MSDYPLALKPLKINPTVEEHRLEYDEQLAEKEYQLERLESELKRFINGQVKKIERDKIRLKREIAELLRQKEALDKFGKQEVIDITAVTN
jgi:hypothetical protein